MKKHMWTKEELKKVIELWNDSTISDLIEVLDVSHYQLYYIVKKLRKNDFELQKKHKIGKLDSLIQDLKNEYEGEYTSNLSK